MSVETHRVLLGACGWKHQGWLNNYYSEELPEDWQLGFYSNEFPVVYVPAADWLDVSESDMAEWREGISDSFRFILEIPEHTLENEQHFIKALEKTKTLDEFCLGLVLKLPLSLRDDSVLFQQRLEMAQAVTHVCVDKDGAALTAEFKAMLVKRHVAEVWDGTLQENEDSLNGGSLAMSHISGEELDMHALRKIVEVCLSVSNENCISVLCLDGDPPSLESLRNAGIILDLL